MKRTIAALLLAALSWGCATERRSRDAGAEAQFFNRHDLAGWTSTTPAYWSVQDGAIVGHSDQPVPRNEFIWSPVEVKDFYLAMDVKLKPNEANAGIQFRSQKHPPHEALGYQADMGQGVWGRLYHESGRKKLFWGDRGEKAVKPGEWNRYEILAVGDRIWTAINGQLAVAVRDPQGEKSGFIALQMHSGPPMTVQYKIDKLVHDPKVSLAGMDEKQLDAALVPPEVDDGNPARPRTRPSTRPAAPSAAAAGDPPTEENTPKPQPATKPAGPSTRPEMKPLPATRPVGNRLSPPLPDVPPQRRFADASLPLPESIAGYEAGKFAIVPGETIVFAGQTNMVRQQQVGALEAQLAVEYARQKPRFRSMAWEGDTVYQQWRDLNFGGWQVQLDWVGATAIIAWFGQTEALNGKAKLDDFITAYGKLIDEWSKRTKRIVLISPMPFEKPSAANGATNLPDHSAKNQDVKAFADAIRTLAASRGLVYVDLYTPYVDRDALRALSGGRSDEPITQNGIHLNARGQVIIGNLIATTLESPYRSSHALDSARQAIVEKNQLWFDNWRPMNWAFAYGDRTHVPYGQAIGEHPPLKVEFEDFKPLIKTADEKIHELAASAS